MEKIRILNKSKKSNRRCQSCEHWEKYETHIFSLKGVFDHYCSNCLSDNYLQDRHYYNCCKNFEWAKNIVDINRLNECPHCSLPIDDIFTKDGGMIRLCLYYSKIKRKDGLDWGHYPECKEKNCPVLHKKLLQGESPLK